MIIPFYEKVVNDNKDMKASYNDWDNIFIGFLNPNGRIFEAYKNHNIGGLSNSFVPFFSVMPFDCAQEEIIAGISAEKLRVKSSLEQGKYDELKAEALLITLDYLGDFYNNFKFPKDKFQEISIRNLSQCKSYIRTISDVMVLMLGFDKVERIRRTITTTKPNINEAFFNYILMDFNIYQIPKLVYNEENIFSIQSQNAFIKNGIERECEEEIKIIKKYIPLNERSKYFR